MLRVVLGLGLLFFSALAFPSQSSSIVHRVKAQEAHSYDRVLFVGEDGLWAVESDLNRKKYPQGGFLLKKLDMQDGQVLIEGLIDELQSAPDALVVTKEYFFFAYTSENKIYRVGKDFRIQAVFDFKVKLSSRYGTWGDGPSGMAWDGNRLWVVAGDGDRFFQVNTDSGAIEKSVISGSEPHYSQKIAYGKGGIWILAGARVIAKIDADTGIPGNEIVLPDELGLNGNNYIEGFGWNNDELWVKVEGDYYQIQYHEKLDGVVSPARSWFQPALIEDANSSLCDGFFNQAKIQFNTSRELHSFYRLLSTDAPGFRKVSLDLSANQWIPLPESIEVGGRQIYLKQMAGPGGWQSAIFASLEPFPANAGEPGSQEFWAKHRQKEWPEFPDPILLEKNGEYFLAGYSNSWPYENHVWSLYRLSPDAEWQLTCRIQLSPQSGYENVPEATRASLEKLRLAVREMTRPDCSGRAGGRFDAWMAAKFKELLYRPWAVYERDWNDPAPIGTYANDMENLEKWALTGVLPYQAFAAYKQQLAETASVLAQYYRDAYGVSAESSEALADRALKVAVGSGIRFYMYSPFSSEDEQKVRQAILGGEPLDVIKNIPLGGYINGDVYQSQESLLNIAIYRPEVVDYLLNQGADPDQVNGFGKTPLMYAAQYDQPATIKKLIEHGATVDAKSTSGGCVNTSGVTALHYATRYASPKTIHALLESGASIFMRAKGGRPERGELPLDWLRYYTRPTFPENPNVAPADVPLLEKTLQPPDEAALKQQANQFMLLGEKRYQQGEIKASYESLLKAAELMPGNERVLSDLSLVALKQGDIPKALEAADWLIDNSKDNKIKASAWFNLGLACEQIARDSGRPMLSFGAGRHACAGVMPFLDAWKLAPSAARAQKIVDVMTGENATVCDIATSSGRYRLQFLHSPATRKQKIYLLRDKSSDLSAPDIYWDVAFYNPKEQKKDPPVRFVPSLSVSYDLGSYVLDELDSEQDVRFPVMVGSQACRSGSSKDYAQGSGLVQLHVAAVGQSAERGHHCPRWQDRCGEMAKAECRIKYADEQCGWLGDVSVEVGEMNAPLILVLSAPDATRWLINNPHQVRIEKVILGGRQGVRHQVLGIAEEVVIERYCERNCAWPFKPKPSLVMGELGSDFRAYHFSGIDEVTGLLPITFQYHGRREGFVVPGPAESLVPVVGGAAH
ncbi:MAG TPA: ankyrin repeat domain-containing protein [Pseudomonadales bacterium]